MIYAKKLYNCGYLSEFGSAARPQAAWLHSLGSLSQNSQEPRHLTICTSPRAPFCKGQLSICSHNRHTLMNAQLLGRQRQIVMGALHVPGNAITFIPLHTNAIPQCPCHLASQAVFWYEINPDTQPICRGLPNWEMASDATRRPGLVKSRNAVSYLLYFPPCDKPSPAYKQWNKGEPRIKQFLIYVGSYSIPKRGREKSNYNNVL